MQHLPNITMLTDPADRCGRCKPGLYPYPYCYMLLIPQPQGMLLSVHLLAFPCYADGCLNTMQAKQLFPAMQMAARTLCKPRGNRLTRSLGAVAPAHTSTSLPSWAVSSG